MGIGNSTARYIEAGGVSFEVDIPDACASIDTRSRGYERREGKGKEGGEGGGSLSRARHSGTLVMKYSDTNGNSNPITSTSVNKKLSKL